MLMTVNTLKTSSFPLKVKFQIMEGMQKGSICFFIQKYLKHLCCVSPRDKVVKASNLKSIFIDSLYVLSLTIGITVKPR